MEERFQMADLVIEVEVLDSVPIPCHGCEDYCGQTHGGDRLICGIHPYGWKDGNDCPDWRGIVGTEETIEFPALDGSTPDLESDDETPSQVFAANFCHFCQFQSELPIPARFATQLTIFECDRCQFQSELPILATFANPCHF